jgi:hypothetical protein
VRICGARVTLKEEKGVKRGAVPILKGSGGKQGKDGGGGVRGRYPRGGGRRKERGAYPSGGRLGVARNVPRSSGAGGATATVPSGGD